MTAQSERLFRCPECGQEHDDFDRECSNECGSELVEVRAEPCSGWHFPGPLLESSQGPASEFSVCMRCGAKLYD